MKWPITSKTSRDSPKRSGAAAQLEGRHRCRTAIHISWIDRLDLFPSLFDEVITPAAVHDEVLRADPSIPGLTALRQAFTAGWLTVQPVRDQRAVQALRATLDGGEAEAIVLMREANADLILLDEKRARRYAAQQGLSLTGTVGILRAARDRGLIPAVLPLLVELRRRSFRISQELEERIRREETTTRTRRAQ